MRVYRTGNSKGTKDMLATWGDGSKVALEEMVPVEIVARFLQNPTKDTCSHSCEASNCTCANYPTSAPAQEVIQQEIMSKTIREQINQKPHARLSSAVSDMIDEAATRTVKCGYHPANRTAKRAEARKAGNKENQKPNIQYGIPTCKGEEPERRFWKY